MPNDDIIFQLLNKELHRQRRGLELIASENFTSLPVIEAMGSVATNKYAEGYPGRRYYGGCEVIDEIEQLAIDRAKKYLRWNMPMCNCIAGHRPMLLCYWALLQPGDTILGLDLSMGGHLTHGSPVNFSGKIYNPVFYGVTVRKDW